MEIINIVDEQGNLVKTMPRKDAENERHQVVRILIRNSKGEILIQRRAKDKKFYPDYYDLGVAETVQAGEKLKGAAVRGLKEELSIDTKGVREWFDMLFSDGKNRRWYRVFMVVYDGEFQIDNDEVTEATFVSIEELHELIKTEKFVPAALKIIERYENEAKTQ